MGWELKPILDDTECSVISRVSLSDGILSFSLNPRTSPPFTPFNNNINSQDRLIFIEMCDNITVLFIISVKYTMQLCTFILYSNWSLSFLGRSLYNAGFIQL